MRFLRSALAGSLMMVLPAVASASAVAQECELGARPIARNRIQMAAAEVNPRGLLALLGPQVPKSENFTPIPVARNCKPTDACLRSCEAKGGDDCYWTCMPKSCK